MEGGGATEENKLRLITLTGDNTKTTLGAQEKMNQSSRSSPDRQRPPHPPAGVTLSLWASERASNKFLRARNTRGMAGEREKSRGAFTVTQRE